MSYGTESEKWHMWNRKNNHSLYMYSLPNTLSSQSSCLISKAKQQLLLICTGTESTLFFTLIFLPKFLFVLLFLYLESFSLRSSVEQLLTINGCSSGEWMMLRLLFPRVCHKNSVSMTQPILWKWPETSKSFQVARLCYKDNTCSLAQCLTII